MNSTLPSRWQEILRREAAENVGTVLAHAREQPTPRRLPRWTIPVLIVGVGSLSLLSVIGGGEPAGKGSVPFDRSTVISTRTAGLAASAEELAPRTATPPTLPTPPPPTPAPRSAPPRRSEPRREVAGACRDCDKRRAAFELPEAPIPAEPSPSPTPSPTPTPPVTINIGTRIDAVLTDPVVTGAAFAPATATLAKDVYVEDRLAIPSGTVLVGEGFATQQDDRAQVVFHAMVRDGKTQPLEGWALQGGEMGIRGKVIRKGSKTKKGAGTVMGAAATALGYGLAGAASGPEGAALAALGHTAAADLSGLGRDWRRSDKVVRVEGGVAIVVYLRRDLEVE